MAGGFPAEPSGTCASAYDYMIDRITDMPPKPPFGVCTMSDGSTYDAAQVAFLNPSRLSPTGWICPEPSPMSASGTNQDGEFVAPVCYPDAEYTPPVLMGRPGYWFLGAPVPAERVSYRFQITIPTGPESAAYVSPLVLTNPGTGFSLTLTPDQLAAYDDQPIIPVEGLQ